MGPALALHSAVVKNYVYLSLLGILVVRPCFSWMVSELNTRELPPQSCKLILNLPAVVQGGAKVTPQIICSGTIIGKTTFLTAAHCFAGKTIESGEVHCPGAKPRSLARWEIPSDFPDTSSSTISCEDRKKDVAVLSVEEPFSAVPVRLPRSEKEALALAVQNKCKVLGYGLDENGKMGNHNGRKAVFGEWKTGTRIRTWTNWSGKVTKREEMAVYERVNACGTFLLEGKSKTPEMEESVIRSGDSGGGLLCEDKEGRWVVTGVTSGTNEHNGEPVAASVSTGHAIELIRNLHRAVLSDLPAHAARKLSH